MSENKKWYMHPERKREIWSLTYRCFWRFKCTRKIVVYWDLGDEWAMTWPLNSDREDEPGLTSMFRLLKSGWRKE